jgi:pyruvate/2-oxoglutarate dehydrogenase complex dihydrolipoamide acyltransferase (E2) component
MPCAGNIAAWKKAEGDEVAAGDSIAEVETDKARDPT